MLGSPTDFERANGLRARVANTVSRVEVKPHWLPGNLRFWYRVQTGAETHEFVLVDAGAGRRAPAFDHARLAAALAKATGQPVRADRLALEQLAFSVDGKQLSFTLPGQHWQFEPPAGALKPADGLAPPPAQGKALAQIPRASTRTGGDTHLTFVNRTAGEVELFWLSTAGELRSYGKVAAGQRREQHTFAGHVWLAVDARGETLATFLGGEQPFTAEITGAPRSTPSDAYAGQPSPKTGRGARRDGTSPDGQRCAFVRDFNVWLADTANAANWADDAQTPSRGRSRRGEGP